VVIHDGIGAAIDGTLKSGANSAGLAENALTITNEGSKLSSIFLPGSRRGGQGADHLRRAESSLQAV
jgi:hypothetical protein